MSEAVSFKNRNNIADVLFRKSEAACIKFRSKLSVIAKEKSKNPKGKVKVEQINDTKKYNRRLTGRDVLNEDERSSGITRIIKGGNT